MLFTIGGMYMVTVVYRPVHNQYLYSEIHNVEKSKHLGITFKK
jgi:hypothetical protein